MSRKEAKKSTSRKSVVIDSDAARQSMEEYSRLLWLAVVASGVSSVDCGVKCFAVRPGDKLVI